jgi:hypothetical protein
MRLSPTVRRGIVTVTTMLYVESGRLGEIGDLYVLPESRMKGLLMRWSRPHGEGYYLPDPTWMVKPMPGQP